MAFLLSWPLWDHIRFCFLFKLYRLKSFHVVSVRGPSQLTGPSNALSNTFLSPDDYTTKTLTLQLFFLPATMKVVAYTYGRGSINLKPYGIERKSLKQKGGRIIVLRHTAADIYIPANVGAGLLRRKGVRVWCKSFFILVLVCPRLIFYYSYKCSLTV